MEDLRARTTLFCGVIALAIALSQLLRGRRGVHVLFAAFASCVAAWYTSQAFAGLFQARIWEHATAILTALLPQFAVHLFEAVLPHESSESRRISPLTKVATALGVPALLVAVSPYYAKPLALGFVYFYVLILLTAALVRLWRRGRASSSRAAGERVRFLVYVGALSVTFTLADFLSYLGVYLPPIGAVLATVFLYVLAESMQRVRLAALYELVGKMLVSTALAFSLAGIFYGFITYIGRFGEMYLNAVIATILFLVLVDPLRSEFERRMHQFFFRERYDFETSLSDVRRRLAHSIEIAEIAQLVTDGLERSRRVTSAALYLRDPEGFQLTRSFGSPAKTRVEELALRPLLVGLEGSLLLEELLRAPTDALAPLVTAAQTLGPHARSVLLSLRVERPADELPVLGAPKGVEERELAGFLVVTDERIRDAFAPEEVAAFEALAVQIGVAIGNTRLYTQLKERDRLAALGAMAAGLAHEIKNPLGSIKGAAQLLEELAPPGPKTESDEFIGIILEETNRLNRVVGSFLDYARPQGGNPGPADVNAIVRRTVQIASNAEDAAGVTIALALADELPYARIDAEQLRQVVLNLVQNAIHAAGSEGTVTLATALRRGYGRRAKAMVDVLVKDNGSGISAKAMTNLFVPFFTTKQRGTGLGLAITQRLVQDAGGRIDVHSQPDEGTQFTVSLPTFEPAAATEENSGENVAAPNSELTLPA